MKLQRSDRPRQVAEGDNPRCFALRVHVERRTLPIIRDRDEMVWKCATQNAAQLFCHQHNTSPHSWLRLVRILKYTSHSEASSHASPVVGEELTIRIGKITPNSFSAAFILSSDVLPDVAIVCTAS